MIHRQGGRDLRAHSLFDALAQFHGHQRIHAEIEEPGILADLVGVDAGHLGHRVAQVVDQQRAALLHRGIGEFLDQSRPPGRKRRHRLCGQTVLHLGQECPLARLLIQRQEAGPVDAGHHAVPGRGRRDVGQPGQGVGGREGLHSALRQPRAGLFVGHAGRPGAEVHADPGDALVSLIPAQSVEEGVGGAVGGLTESTPHGGDRGGAEEEVELQVRRGLTEMPGAPNLSGEDTVGFGVVEGAQRGGADLAGRMHDAGQRRKVGGDAGHQARHVVGVGDVGGDDLQRAPVLRAQRVDPLRGGVVGRASAGEHQMSGAVGGEVPGDLQSDRPQSTGHQIGGVVAQRQRVCCGPAGPADQTGDQHRLVADRDLVFPGGRVGWAPDQVGEAGPFVRRGVAVCGQVGEAAPQLRQFQSRGAAEAPQTALLGRHGVGVGGVLRAPGHQPDRAAQFGGRCRTEQPAGAAEGAVLHPQQ